MRAPNEEIRKLKKLLLTVPDRVSIPDETAKRIRSLRRELSARARAFAKKPSTKTIAAQWMRISLRCERCAGFEIMRPGARDRWEIRHDSLPGKLLDFFSTREAARRFVLQNFYEYEVRE